MNEINLWIIIGSLGSFIGLIITIVTLWNNNKSMRKGLENLSDIVELQRQKKINDNYRFELEQKQKETQNTLGKISLGMAIFEFIVSHPGDEEEMTGEYEE